MKNEKLYLIAGDTYHKHIDEEVHLYGLLHQLAFMAGKVKDAEDMENFQDTAVRYGQIAEELFEGWNIPGRYLVYGDKGTGRDARSLDVYLSDNGIFRKKNRNGSIWSLPLSAAVFYLTPVASDGFRSTLKPSAYDPEKKNGNLLAQVIFQENPVSETAALNPDWVEWLMGFPLGWTDVSCGQPSRRVSPA